MLLVIVKLFNLDVEGILLQLELLSLLAKDLASDLGLQAVHSLLEQD